MELQTKVADVRMGGYWFGLILGDFGCGHVQQWDGWMDVGKWREGWDAR